MGRKTWESIPKKFRPFRDRLNVVLSRDPNAAESLALPSDVLIAHSLEEALEKLSTSPVHDIFVIGGGAVYEEAVKLPQCNRVYLTEVLTELDDTQFDAFFPVLPASRFRLTRRSRILTDVNHSYRFTEYDSIDDGELLGSKASTSIGTASPIADGSSGESKSHTAPPTPECVAAVVETQMKNKEEAQYLDIVREIIATGARRGDRTGTGTLSKFSVQMRFSLRDGQFPLLTTKKVRCVYFFDRCFSHCVEQVASVCCVE